MSSVYTTLASFLKAWTKRSGRFGRGSFEDFRSGLRRRELVSDHLGLRIAEVRTPESPTALTSSGFCLAFMMFGSFGYRGLLRLYRR